jgi:hypothetical protein
LNKKISFLLFSKFNNRIICNPTGDSVGVITTADNRLQRADYDPRLFTSELLTLFSMIIGEKAAKHEKIIGKKQRLIACFN